MSLLLLILKLIPVVALLILALTIRTKVKKEILGNAFDCCLGQSSIDPKLNNYNFSGLYISLNTLQ